MKNKLNYLLTCFTVLFIASCSKSESVVSNNFNTSKLNEDSSFVSLYHQELELSSFIKEIAQQKGITLNDLKDKIANISNSNLNKSDQVDKLDSLMGSGTSEYIKSYSQKFTKNLNQLNANNKNYSLKDVDDACREIFYREAMLRIKANEESMVIGTIGDDCGLTYYLCIGGATAASILCHAGCISLTAGFGAPACVLLCGTMQVAAGAACITSYCPIPK